MNENDNFTEAFNIYEEILVMPYFQRMIGKRGRESELLLETVTLSV